MNIPDALKPYATGELASRYVNVDELDWKPTPRRAST